MVFVVKSLSCVWSDSLWPHGLQHARVPCPSPSPGFCSNSCPLSQWCIQHLILCRPLFSSCSQSFPASGSLPGSWLFASGGQSIRASASVLPMNNQDWPPLGWTGLISWLSRGFSRVFSNTTVQKHQFFGSHLSGTSLVAQLVKTLPAVQETWVRFLGQEDPLEKEMATHSSILAWKILWTEEPGGCSPGVTKSQTRLSD